MLGRTDGQRLDVEAATAEQSGDPGQDAGSVDAVIEQAMKINDRPVVVDFIVHRDAMVWPMVAAGTSNDDIKYARDLAPDFDEDDL